MQALRTASSQPCSASWVDTRKVMLPRPDERTFPRMPSTRVTTEKLKDRASLSFDESAVTSLCDDVQWHVQWHVQWQIQWQVQWRQVQ